MSTNQNRPLILMDIDGVANAFGAWRNVQDDTARRGYRTEQPSTGFTYARSGGYSLLIPSDYPEHFEALMDLGDVMHATMWMDKADEFAAAAGLPLGLPFIDFDAHKRPDDMPFHGRIGTGVAQYKQPGIAATAGDRPVVWVDDDLVIENWLWAENRNERGFPTLLIQPDPAVGFTAEHLQEIRDWADSLVEDAA